MTFIPHPSRYAPRTAEAVVRFEDAQPRAAGEIFVIVAQSRNLFRGTGFQCLAAEHFAVVEFRIGHSVQIDFETPFKVICARPPIAYAKAEAYMDMIFKLRALVPVLCFACTMSGKALGTFDGPGPFDVTHWTRSVPV